MVRFPYAKINLGLNVLARRSDGFHDIESVMVPIPLSDVLEIVVDPKIPSGELIFERSGLAIAGVEQEDLCWKAVKAVGVDHALPGLRMHLHKVIPMGAGLGGGSSDGTQVLLLLNDLIPLGLGTEELHRLAASLGSDCSFFLAHTPKIVRGRGERTVDLDLDLSGIYLLLIDPGFHVSTAEVYGMTKPTGTHWDIEGTLVRSKIRTWRNTVVNTMESAVFAQHPELARIKKAVYEGGAIYASMSGSGSCMFGLFEGPPPVMAFPAALRTWSFAL